MANQRIKGKGFKIGRGFGNENKGKGTHL